MASKFMSLKCFIDKICDEIRQGEPRDCESKKQVKQFLALMKKYKHKGLVHTGKDALAPTDEQWQTIFKYHEGKVNHHETNLVRTFKGKRIDQDKLAKHKADYAFSKQIKQYADQLMREHQIIAYSTRLLPARGDSKRRTKLIPKTSSMKASLNAKTRSGHLYQSAPKKKTTDTHPSNDDSQDCETQSDSGSDSESEGTRRHERVKKNRRSEQQEEKGVQQQMSSTPPPLTEEMLQFYDKEEHFYNTEPPPYPRNAKTPPSKQGPYQIPMNELQRHLQQYGTPVPPDAIPLPFNPNMVDSSTPLTVPQMQVPLKDIEYQQILGGELMIRKPSPNVKSQVQDIQQRMSSMVDVMRGQNDTLKEVLINQTKASEEEKKKAREKFERDVQCLEMHMDDVEAAKRELIIIKDIPKEQQQRQQTAKLLAEKADLMWEKQKLEKEHLEQLQEEAERCRRQDNRATTKQQGQAARPKNPFHPPETTSAKICEHPIYIAGSFTGRVDESTVNGAYISGELDPLPDRQEDQVSIMTVQKPTNPFMKIPPEGNQTVMPLRTTTTGQAVYTPFTMKDMASVVQGLPPLEKGGPAFVRSLIKQTAGEVLCFGDVVAIITRMSSESTAVKVETQLQTRLASQRLTKTTPLALFQDELKSILKDIYPVTTPEELQSLKMKNDEAYYSYKSRATDVFHDTTGEPVRPGDPLTVFFRTALIKGMPKPVREVLDHVVGLIHLEEDQFDRQCQHHCAKFLKDKDENDEEKIRLETAKLRLEMRKMQEEPEKDKKKIMNVHNSEPDQDHDTLKMATAITMALANLGQQMDTAQLNTALQSTMMATAPTLTPQSSALPPVNIYNNWRSRRGRENFRGGGPGGDNQYQNPKQKPNVGWISQTWDLNNVTRGIDIY